MSSVRVVACFHQTCLPPIPTQKRHVIISALVMSCQMAHVAPRASHSVYMFKLCHRGCGNYFGVGE